MLNEAPSFIAAVTAPGSIVAGGALIVAAWVGRRVLHLAERSFDQMAQKVVELPSAAELEKERKSLFDKLEEFADEAREERFKVGEFREYLVRTLADHSARIDNLERKR